MRTSKVITHNLTITIEKFLPSAACFTQNKRFTAEFSDCIVDGLSLKKMVGYEIRAVPGKGRALFSTIKFQKGDTILQEEPVVSSQFSWNSSCKYLACEYCMRPLETAEENISRLGTQKGTEPITLPYAECCPVKFIQHLQVKCPNCPIRYCSVECMHTALNRYHRVLCLGADYHNPNHPLNILNEAWKKIHYPPETTTISLIVKLVAMYKQTEQKEQLFNAIQDFYHELINEKLMISHKMLGENHQHNLNNLFNLFRKSFDFTGIESFQNIDMFKRLFALIGENGQGIGTSSFATWVKNVSELELHIDEKLAADEFIDSCYAQLEEVTGLQFLNNEGSALYSLESKANHSCVPNAENCFKESNHVLHLVANRVIEIGEEICISYLDDCLLSRSRHSRQKELRENYLFNCSCQKCVEQKSDPDVTSDEEDDEESMDEN